MSLVMFPSLTQSIMEFSAPLMFSQALSTNFMNIEVVTCVQIS